MKDGAHTHHTHDSGGLWLAIVIGLVLVAGSGAFASRLAEVVRLLLIVLAVTAGLAITACVIVAIRHRQPRTPNASHPVVVSPPGQPNGDIAALRAELSALRRQIAAVTAPDDISGLDDWRSAQDRETS